MVLHNFAMTDERCTLQYSRSHDTDQCWSQTRVPVLQSLARMGAVVIGIDLAQKSVDVATQHATGDPSISGRLTYRTASAEQLLAEGDRDSSYTISA